MRAKQYHYTLEDIAAAAGVTVETVRRAVRNRSLNPDSLDSVITYIVYWKVYRQ